MTGWRAEKEKGMSFRPCFGPGAGKGRAERVNLVQANGPAGPRAAHFGPDGGPPFRGDHQGGKKKPRAIERHSAGPTGGVGHAGTPETRGNVTPARFRRSTARG